MTAWVVGGSTVFGVGQRDDRTLASQLVRQAAREGIDLQVRNLGTVGWTAHQQVTDVERRLDAGEPAPDLLVVVDGFNDALAAAAEELTGDVSDSPLRLDRVDVVAAITTDRRLDGAAVERAVQRASTAHAAELARLAEALEGRGTEVVSFFQPDAFASPTQLAAVADLYRDVPGIVERPEFGVVLDGVRARLTGPGQQVVDLRDVYGRRSDPMFLDVVHTGEEGAAVLAEAVYATLSPRLLALAR